jgi:hypothetical protein
MKEKPKKKPFFARYLEAQELEKVAGGGPITLKYPSDKEEHDQTMKYPSDGDDDDSPI